MFLATLSWPPPNKIWRERIAIPVQALSKLSLVGASICSKIYSTKFLREDCSVCRGRAPARHEYVPDPEIQRMFRIHCLHTFPVLGSIFVLARGDVLHTQRCVCDYRQPFLLGVGQLHPQEQIIDIAIDGLSITTTTSQPTSQPTCKPHTTSPI